MWIYEENDDGKWIVGHYDPKKEFHTESEHTDKAAAAHRCHFLNGGTLPYRPSGDTAVSPISAASSGGELPAVEENTPPNSAEARRRRDIRRGVSSAQ